MDATVRLNAQGAPDSIQWSVDLPAPPSRAAIVAGPVVAVPLTSGAVAARRLGTGEPAWTVTLRAEHSLEADADRIYVPSGDAIHALAAESGETVWRTPTGGPLTAPPFARGGWLIVAAQGEVFAIRASDGDVVWRKSIGTVRSRPGLDGDLLVVAVAAADAGVQAATMPKAAPAADGGMLVAIDLRNGEERWRYLARATPSDPLVIGDRVYAGTSDKLLLALHAGSGRKDWIRVVGAEVRGRPAVDDRHLYFAAADNTIRALDRGDGAIEWWQGLSYRPAGGPVVWPGGVLVPGINVLLLPVFAPRTGAAAGRISLARNLARPPLFAERPEGRIELVAITGGLDDTWALTLMVPSSVPSLSLQPLTTLPGEPLAGPETPR